MPQAPFMPRGKSLLKFTATLTDNVLPFSVTRAELNAATNLTEEIVEIGGMQYSNEPIDIETLATTFATQIAGGDTAEAPTFTFLDADVAPASNAIRTALAKGATGYLLALRYGDVAGRRLEIWKVTCTGANDEWHASNEPARYAVTFAVTERPTQDAIVPAAV